MNIKEFKDAFTEVKNKALDLYKTKKYETPFMGLSDGYVHGSIRTAWIEDDILILSGSPVLPEDEKITYKYAVDFGAFSWEDIETILNDNEENLDLDVNFVLNGKPHKITTMKNDAFPHNNEDEGWNFIEVVGEKI